MTRRTINLIKTKTSVLPELEVAETYLRKAGSFLVISLVVSGLIVGGVFVYLSLSLERTQQDKQTLTRSITESSVKEGLLAAIKARSVIAGNIIGNQKPVARLFDTIAATAPSTNLASVSFDENSEVVIAVRAQSLDEVMVIANALIKQQEERRVNNPKLVSLTLSREGTIEASFSFVALF